MKRNLVSAILLSLIIVITLAMPVFADDGAPCTGDVPSGTMGAPSTNVSRPGGSIPAADNGFSTSILPDAPSYNKSKTDKYLFNGTEANTNVSYTFFKFVVPPHPGVWHDCLKFGAHYVYGKNETPDTTGKTGAYYFRNNSWSRETLTWNSMWNQAFHTNRGKLLDSFQIPLDGIYKYYEWNVGGVDPDIWEKGGTLTIVLAQVNNNAGYYWRDFENTFYTDDDKHPPYLRLCGSHRGTESVTSTPKGSWLPGTTSVGTPTDSVRQVPVSMPSITVKSASLSTAKVAPGEAVTVTADVINTGNASGSSSIQVYINGEPDSAQAVTVSSGSSAPVTFTVKRSEPGTYTVHVGSVPAGSFTVDAFANPDFLVYGLIALFTVGIGVAIYMVTRRRTA